MSTNNRARELTKTGSSYFSVHLAAMEVIVSGLKALSLMKGDVSEALRNRAHVHLGMGQMLGLKDVDLSEHDLKEKKNGINPSFLLQKTN